jgi:hypothetical protein
VAGWLLGWLVGLSGDNSSVLCAIAEREIHTLNVVIVLSDYLASVLKSIVTRLGLSSGHV